MFQNFIKYLMKLLKILILVIKGYTQVVKSMPSLFQKEKGEIQPVYTDTDRRIVREIG